MDAELLAEARRLHHARRFAEAEQLCRQVLKGQPGNPDALYRLARISQSIGQLPVAAALLQRALAARPASRSFRKVLGDVLQAQGKPFQATKHYELLISADAEYAEAHHNLGIALLQAGLPEKAVSQIRTALALAPERSELHSNLLLAMQYLPSARREEMLQEALDWAARYASAEAHHQHANPRDPGRRLRIGYVSADFRQHPVGLFIEPVLLAHDRAQVEVFCYASSWAEDNLTNRLRSAAEHWRTTAGLSDTDADDLIRSDGIDILVDLGGHTAGNRLLLFSRKPAPIQATWMGYSDTTGLANIDYFLADRHICPDGDEAYFAESVVRLPSYFLCYLPDADAPHVAPPPMLSNGYTTFGCFNSLAKVNSQVVSVWSDILQQLPDARLCLKTDALMDNGVRARYFRLFEERGITPERISLLPRSASWKDYATAFAQIDIALDPFPFNGGTTSMDGLWMGVPLVSLSGDRCVSRFGHGILCTIGLPELVARTTEEYVAKAVDLARAPSRIAELRAGLRSRMATSSLCDAAGFTRDLESVYRLFWRTWCESPTG